MRVIKREKRACEGYEEQGGQCAPLPTRIIDKGLASDRVTIDTVVSKYADHVPNPGPEPSEIGQKEHVRSRR